MIVMSVNLIRNFAIDIALLHTIRLHEDGVTFVEFKCNLDLFKGDHNPKFTLSLIALNVMVFEVEVYNRAHNSDG